jgi:hypothetical protein
MKSFKEFMLEDITTPIRRGDQAQYRSSMLKPRETETRDKIKTGMEKGKITGTATVDGNQLDALQAYDIIHGSKGVSPNAGGTGASSATQPSTSLGGNLIDKTYADGQSNRRISSTTGGVGMNTSSTLGKYSSSLRIY